ncbi:osmotically-inducible protein OsmY [Burkholderia ambifaria]|nr:BON domain-containing protein [Burkholderia ambifaria]MDR6496859.1 osmotically-inducible protein OsmY [Burkholderia ambifaria]
MITISALFKREEEMRHIKLAALALVPVFVVATTAFAQSTPSVPASSAATISKKQARRANWHIETQVRKSLTRTQGLSTSDIRVVARGNTVTLDGTVPEQNQVQLAQNAAQVAAPAKAIVNNLSVKEAGH